MENIYKIKKGKKVSASYYQIENGVSTLISTTTYKYKKGKPAKAISVSADGKRTTVNTYKNGKLAKTAL